MASPPTLESAVLRVATRLQPAQPVDDDNVDFFVGDAPDAAKRKIKRAFCEPGNLDFNPPLALAEFLLTSKRVPTVTVQRKPENGGDATYDAQSIAQLRADFASEQLHPGDLKPAVIAALATSLLTDADVSKSPNFKQHALALKQHAKKQSKK